MPSFKDLQAKYGDDYDKIINELTKDTIDDRRTDEYIAEYKGKRERRSKSVGKRENKFIGEGQDRKIVEVARLVFDFPKKIVRTGVAFCVGGEMVVSSGGDADDAFNVFKSTWEKSLKMKNNIKKFVRTVMIETKAALLFYPVVEGDNESKASDIRVMLLNNKSGEFYPHFDKYNDMDAFTRRYQTKNDDNKDITIVEVYTDEKIFTFTKESGTWIKDEKVNMFKKIPVVYAEKDEPEWENIVTLMDSFEMRMSRLADSNDYFAEPLLKLFGEVENLPGKDKVGKMVQFKMKESLDKGTVMHGDADYLTWDQTPESIKLEIETTRTGIYDHSSTPNTSFDNMKSIGGDLSGKALLFMFIDARLKAEDNMETYGEAVQRMVSVVKSGVGEIIETRHKNDLEEADIEVVFKDPLPDDLSDWLETLGKAKADQIMSTEAVVDQNPLVKDKKKELNYLKSNAAKEGDTIIGSQE